MGAVVAAAFRAGRCLLRGDRIGPAGGTDRLRGDRGPLHQHVADRRCANSEASVGDWLRQLQEQNLALREHDWTPLYEIQRLAGYAGQTLFDSILVFENYPIDQALRRTGENGPRLGRVEHVTPTNYALAVAVFAGADALNLEFNYDRARFDEAGILRYGTACARLLERIAANAERPFGDLGCRDNDETRRMLDWSGIAALAASRSSSYVGVVTHIEARAAQAPSAVALICGDE